LSHAIASLAARGATVDIFVNDVTKVWHSAGHAPVAALSATQHHFVSNKFSCLLGPSGCGKSTLIQIIGGLEPASSGEVRIVHPDSKHQQPLGTHSVMMWQGLNLFPWRSVLDNVAFGLEVAGVAKAERHARAAAMLAAVGLTGFGGHLPRQLSGGMRQRVALARALILERPIMLMDEPFAALDAQTKIVMQEELLRIFEASSKTILFVTHAIDEAILLGDEIVVMTARPGRIKEVITVDLPRPRSIEMVNTPQFGALFKRIFHLIRDEVNRAMAEQAEAVQ
jgi:NitT/TauT family transport system ATP-binding protein